MKSPLKFYAAVKFGKAMPKRVGHADSEFLPDEVTEFHAVSRERFHRRLTQPAIDDKYRAMCGELVEIVYPIKFNPNEDGACIKCMRKVLKQTDELVDGAALRFSSTSK